MDIAKFKPAIVCTIYIASTPEKVWQALEALYRDDPAAEQILRELEKYRAQQK